MPADAVEMELELSSQVQQLIEENLKRRSPAEAFARAKINLVSKGIEERGIKDFQFDRLWAVFPDKVISVLISTAHPRRVRRQEEEERNIVESGGNFSMLCKLHPAIWSNRAHRFSWKGAGTEDSTTP